MEKKIAVFAAQLAMLPKDARVLVALSGGMDSMCLAHCLKEMGVDLVAAHFNHRLRGEDADEDERFVRVWCRENGIDCRVGSADVAALAAQNGWSVEEAGRRARYEFLEKTADEIGADRIATAHHALDNAETLLFNLVRGTGADGLAGIPPVRGRLIRPMLTVTKEEIESYAKEHSVPHRTDKTNDDTAYTRNYIRHEILPKLAAVNGAYAEHLSESALQLRKESAFLNELAAQRMAGLSTDNNMVSLPCAVLCEANEVLRLRMLRLMLGKLSVGKKDFTAAHYHELAALALRRSSAQLDLPHGVRAQCDGETLSLQLKAEKLPENVKLLLNTTLDWGEYTISVRKADKNRLLADDIFYLPYDTISALRVGVWNPRDRMTLPGKPERTLKRLFSEKSVTASQRDRTPVIRCGERPAAVFGIGAAQEFIPSAQADALEIRITRKHDK